MFLVQSMADRLTDIVTDAVMTIRKPEEPIDLYMVSLTEAFFCLGGSAAQGDLPCVSEAGGGESP